jgi:hypothetical protein
MMKAVLWVPSSSPLNVYRITLATAGLAVGTQEMYELSVNQYDMKFFLDCALVLIYHIHRGPQGIPQQSWVMILVMLCENLVAIKVCKVVLVFSCVADSLCNACSTTGTSLCLRPSLCG